VTPELHLRTGLVQDGRGRIVSTREPEPAPGPRFTLIRGRSRCVWAARADVPDELAARLDALAAREPPLGDGDLRAAPRNADAYRSLVGGDSDSGPAFGFPDELGPPGDVVAIASLQDLERHFRGWTAAEIPGRVPILAVVEGGYPVSVCFCARLSDEAAEAGVETAAAFRGRGFAPRVTAAWAAAIRASGRIPLYSTALENTASLAVARKLGLIPYASHFSLVDGRARTT
jgi:RimJ/RimL family protein N-acetyltransferase